MSSFPPPDPREPRRRAGDPPWVQNYIRQLAALREIASESQRFVEHLRSSFPVDELPWVFEGSSLGESAVTTVLNGASRLDRLLYPLRLRFDATLYDEICLLNPDDDPQRFLPPKTVATFRQEPFRGSNASIRYAFASFAGDPQAVIHYCKTAEAMRHIPATLYTAVEAVMASHDRLLRHYQWGAWVAGDSSQSWPWRWPDVPIVPRSHLDALRMTAERLGELACADLTPPDNSAPPPKPDRLPPQRVTTMPFIPAGIDPDDIEAGRRAALDCLNATWMALYLFHIRSVHQGEALAQLREAIHHADCYHLFGARARARHRADLALKALDSTATTPNWSDWLDAREELLLLSREIEQGDRPVPPTLVERVAALRSDCAAERDLLLNRLKMRDHGCGDQGTPAGWVLSMESIKRRWRQLLPEPEYPPPALPALSSPEAVLDALDALLRALALIAQPEPSAPTLGTQAVNPTACAVFQAPADAHPDGPEGGCWLWWANKRYDVPKGVVYRLLAFMWGRTSASYDTLDHDVFETGFLPATLRARTSEVNKVLEKADVPWRLKPDSVNRFLTKQPTD